jgi:hypothetical protein
MVITCAAVSAELKFDLEPSQVLSNHHLIDVGIHMAGPHEDKDCGMQKEANRGVPLLQWIYDTLCTAASASMTLAAHLRPV